MSGTRYYPAPSGADETFIPPPKCVGPESNHCRPDKERRTGASDAKVKSIREPLPISNEKQQTSSTRTAPQRCGAPLHFIEETIRKQGTTVALCARRLGISFEDARSQANASSDLTLSQLFAWREVLDVPLAELVPFVGVVPDPIRNRALLLRIIKTARQLQEASCGERLEPVATSLVDQLLELVPEFESIPPWPTIGQSHASREDGSTIRRVDSDFSKFMEEHS